MPSSFTQFIAAMQAASSMRLMVLSLNPWNATSISVESSG
jgi:hypothetical protein